MRTRYRWCTLCGGTLHEVDNWPDNCRPEENYAKSDLPAPAIITDSLPGGVNGLYHHAARKKIDSKQQYRAATKRHGCIEMGNDRQGPRQDVAWDERSVQSSINDALRESGVVSECDANKVNLNG